MHYRPVLISQLAGTPTNWAFVAYMGGSVTSVEVFRLVIAVVAIAKKVFLDDAKFVCIE